MENNDNTGFSRRKFLKRGAIVLGGTVVASYMGCSPMRRFAAQKAESMDLPAVLSSMEPDFWFEVLADNTILFKSPKIEMGQGVTTGLAMLAAEELEVSLEQIKVEHANTTSGVVDAFGTGGSSSTLSLYKPIREVAATMREMLREAAAKQWGVKASEVKIINGVCAVGDKKMTFAEIAKNTKEWDIPKTPALKPESAFKYVGKNVKRVDLKAKVMGTAEYTIDHHLPEMLHAFTLESTYIGGKIKSIDTKEAEQSSGVVKVVNQDGLVAVVAKTRYAAEMALNKIKVEWDVPKKWQQADIELLVTVGKGKSVSVQKEGNALSMLEENPAKVFRQEYRLPIAAHAQMEVFGAIADVKNNKTTIIIGTQTPGFIRDQVAKDLDIDKDNVEVQTPFLGGGFGRRTPKNYASKAAILSKIVGKPVKIIPTREQEFQYSLYRPNTHHVLQAKIDEKGNVEAITHDQATPDMMLKAMGGSGALTLLGSDWISAGHGASILYNVKNKATNVHNIEVPYPASIWRAVGIFPNTFAIESFINELAHKTQKDPIDFRISLLKNGDEITERMVKVLEVLKEKSNWKAGKKEGFGRGIAICNDRKTIAAAAIEIEIIENQVRVKKVTHVTDCGKAINPEGIRQQIEGCIMMGISSALYEEITIVDSQISNSNYHKYPVAMLRDTPDIEMVILENAPEPYGIGEPPLGPIAPAIAAAIFDLTGKNLRNLPMKLV